VSTHSRPIAHPADMSLRTQLRGRVVGQRDEDYDELRRVFNGMFDRRPAVIARAADEHDVRTAILVAREHDLEVAVRCGGHSAPGFGTCDGGLVIDMRDIATAHVDPQRRIVRAGGGMDWGALDAATQEHGLAVTGGRVSSTGVAGFTLGSGSGWLERVMGFAADSLLSARLVTAEGDIVTASASENPDLFWALRGGGGNFGVVFEFEFALQPVGPIVLGGSRFYGIDVAGAVISAFRDAMEDAPDEVCADARRSRTCCCGQATSTMPKPASLVSMRWARRPWTWWSPSPTRRCSARSTRSPGPECATTTPPG
jgi:FAD/FMN-containing dehydrogenase